MSENNQVIEREIEGIKYTFSGLSTKKKKNSSKA